VYSTVRRIAVIYDIGAATPVDVITGLAGVTEPLFVLPDSEPGRACGANTTIDGRW
jgi:hypothetical protein